MNKKETSTSTTLVKFLRERVSDFYFKKKEDMRFITAASKSCYILQS